jgi:release factor glutamine methyltransferase
MAILQTVTTRLNDAGFIAADEEAQELLDCAVGDEAVLDALVERRLSGEPLAWITGFAMFCGARIKVDRGVFVPRWQSEPLARRAAWRLPLRGVGIDLCTGSGAIAKTLFCDRPNSRVVASDLDQRAVACAASNGVEVFHGDLFTPLPRELEGQVDVIVGVVPYVPTRSMALLPRDTLVFESTLSYDGGEDGVEILRRVLEESPKFLHSGGFLLLELGGEEADVLRDDLARYSFKDITVLSDDDGDVRGIEATMGS